MDKRFVHSNGLGDSFGTVVAALVIGKMKRLEGTVITLQVLSDSFTASERNFIRIEIEHLKRSILEQVLHNNVESIIPELVLSHGDLLEPNVILEHLSEVDCY